MKFYFLTCVVDFCLIRGVCVHVCVTVETGGYPLWVLANDEGIEELKDERGKIAEQGLSQRSKKKIQVVYGHTTLF